MLEEFFRDNFGWDDMCFFWFLPREAAMRGEVVLVWFGEYLVSYSLMFSRLEGCCFQILD